MTTFLNIGLFVLSIIGILFLIFGTIFLGILTFLAVKLYKWSKRRGASIKTAEDKIQVIIDTVQTLLDKVKNFNAKEYGRSLFIKGAAKDE